MIKTFIISICLVLSLPVLAQKTKTQKDSASITLRYHFDKERALNDLKSGQAKLLVKGGIAPMAPSPADNPFEKKYKISYIHFDCVMPDPKKMEEYNKVIFEYLDTIYGTDWRKEVRKDIVGLRTK